MRTLVVFDLDGTLIDSFADIAAAINAALARRGLPAHSVEAVKGMVGDGVGKLAERAAPGLPPGDYPAIAADMIAYYAEHPADHARLYDGLGAVLDALDREGVPFAILSNKPHALTVACCELLGLAGRASGVQGDDPPRIPRKPDTAGLKALMGSAGADRCVIVGDGVPDGKLAAAAGARFVAVTWGTRSRAELEGLAPFAVADSPAELAPAILRAVAP